MSKYLESVWWPILLKYRSAKSFQYLQKLNPEVLYQCRLSGRYKRRIARMTLQKWDESVPLTLITQKNASPRFSTRLSDEYSTHEEQDQLYILDSSNFQTSFLLRMTHIRENLIKFSYSHVSSVHHLFTFKRISSHSIDRQNNLCLLKIFSVRFFESFRSFLGSIEERT